MNPMTTFMILETENLNVSLKAVGITIGIFSILLTACAFYTYMVYRKMQKRKKRTDLIQRARG
ncbi:hypothetical protein GCM10010082_31940 [Kushneria pakistanensis]|uniref:DUF3149 domain-containing protein n=1 Tax=Kushneria pakistanensis TaxID=1508770 RepID=A0ABQ3FRJ3_9GAMM|nr:hypothetical protein GCM10010082_31940 [Kushneria pakistanensis]